MPETKLNIMPPAQPDSIGLAVEVQQKFNAPSGAVCERHDIRTDEMCGQQADYLFIVKHDGARSAISTCDKHKSGQY
jgi:hypothetical protein